MAKLGSFPTTEFKKLQKQINKLQAETDKFIESCAKELAARLLAKVIKRTLPGEYDKPVHFTTSTGKEVSFTPHTGKTGGTLRRGWTAKTHEEAASGGNSSGDDATAKKYANSLTIKHNGNVLTVDIINPVEYASYVEYGHRTANHKGWVKGRFMLTTSEEEIRQIAPKVLEAKIEKLLKKMNK